MPGSMQPPPRMYGMAPPGANPGIGPIPGAMGQSPISGAQGSSPSKIDPNQIPRPMPTSSEIVFETRQGNQGNLPPVRLLKLFSTKALLGEDHLNQCLKFLSFL